MEWYVEMHSILSGTVRLQDRTIALAKKFGWVLALPDAKHTRTSAKGNFDCQIYSIGFIMLHKIYNSLE